MPSLASIHLALIGRGGHRFALEKLSTSKLERLALRGCTINSRLLRKILSGKGLSAFEYEPARARVKETTGSHNCLLELVALLAESRLLLKKLTLIPIGDCTKRSSLKIFENMDGLEMPHPWVLDTPTDEVDPETIYALLVDQLPNTLICIRLHHLNYDAQTKVIIEQLAMLKIHNMLPDLNAVGFYLQSAMVSFFMTVSTGTTWESLPDLEEKVQEEFGKVYKRAGITMVVEQPAV
jgi:hypothetical protein